MVKATEKKRSNGAGRSGAVLRLTTRADEIVSHVSIDDVPYELANPAHFGLKEGGAIWRAMDRITELETLADADDFEPTAEQEHEYRDRLIQVAAKALPDAPLAKLQKLPTGELADLALHFFAEAARANPRLSMIFQERQQPSRSTGTTSSPISSGPTPATRGSG
ncbi:MAG TPA: hypothetical protein VGR85_08990 [Candidatus Limnocylindria bacterium]|nr:hypothetical protein [Candidatus Limnocylindria bacterium]